MSYTKTITAKRITLHAEILNLRSKLAPGEGISISFPSPEKRKASCEAFYNINKIEKIFHYKLSILNQLTVWVQDLRDRPRVAKSLSFNPKTTAKLLLTFPEEAFSIINEFLTKSNWFNEASLVELRREYFYLLEERDNNQASHLKNKVTQQAAEECFSEPERSIPESVPRKEKL